MRKTSRDRRKKGKRVGGKVIKQLIFFFYNLAANCSRIANFIGFKSSDGACFLTFIAFSMLKFNIYTI